MSGFHFLDKISKVTGESVIQACLRFYLGTALTFCYVSTILGKVKASIHCLPTGWLFKYRLDPAPCRNQDFCLLLWTGKSANVTSNDSVSENDCKRGNSDSLTPLSYSRIDRKLTSHGVHFPNYTTHTDSDYMIGIHCLVFLSVCSAKTK